MSESPSATVSLPADQVVRVAFDHDRLRLTLTPDTVHIRPDDKIIWLFTGIPDGFFPWIRFQPEGSGESEPGPLPVESLMQNAGGLWGKIAADPGTYVYRATIQTRYSADREDEPGSFFSSPARLVVREGDPDPAGVQVVKVSRGEDGKLAADPGYVSLHEGGQVEWRFDAAILQDSRELLKPRVQFTAYGSKSQGAEPVRDLSLGPFTTFAYWADPQGGGAVVTATGYAAHPAGLYRYRVLAFRESDGQVVWASSPDPTIDDEGPPP